MLPKQVVTYLKQEYLRRRPFCFLVDSEYRLKQAWVGLDPLSICDLSEGDDTLDKAPFLLGALSERVQVLPFVSTAQGDVFEVHTIPSEVDHFVVVLDASEDHHALRDTQQLANEDRLQGANQRKLIERQSELIADLVEAKSELDHRQREAERSNAEKNEFIAMMSHEFRTPVASIINYADLALDQKATASDIRKSSEAIGRASRHLASLVETVLDDAKLESEHALKKTPFEVMSMVSDLSTIMAPLAAEKGLSFAAFLADSVPSFLYADEVSLRQILVNLLGNAVKYTNQGSVRLNIDWESGNLKATVVDTGPGISSADQAKIFQAFERGSDANAQAAGTGLGLAITMDLIKRMDGELNISSFIGEGCTIQMDVPAAIAEGVDVGEAILPTHAAKLNSSEPTSILICDDDEDMLELYQYYLHRAGYGLILAKDARDAVVKTLAYSPDIVLMDIFTPTMNGHEAAKELREAGFSNPIIAVTGTKVSEAEKKVFNDYLRKPFQMSELLEKIYISIQDD